MYKIRRKPWAKFVGVSNGQKSPAKEKEEQHDRNIKNLHCILELIQHHYQIERENVRSNNTKKQDALARYQHEFENPVFNQEQLLISNSKTASDKRPYTLGLRRLLELELKDPTEILLTLDAPRSGFLELLNSNSMSREMVEVLLKVLSKVCMAKEARILISLINKIVAKSQFVQRHLQKFMIDLQRVNTYEISINSCFDNMLQFLAKFQQIQPVTSSEIITFIIPLIKTTLEKLCRRLIRVNPNIYNKIDVLERNKESVLEEHDEKTRKRIAKSEQIQSEQPPEDYVTIPILPTKEDFTNKRPFLRPNITHGSYVDATHYLDVQFRLLREDYVRPLRESIETFKTWANRKDSNKRVSVYSNVQVLCPYNTEGGLVHLISFDAKPFANVQWEVSKRFLLGSLLCLSSDGFETMLFATVAKRDPLQLKKGRLEVHFEELCENIFSIPPSTLFTMVESEAYFEAFRHTLASLQKMDESTLPLKDYIVNVKKNVEAPRYLKPNSSYDFCFTFDTLTEALAEKVKFPVLCTEQWPSSEDLELDHSQYFALQAALTKEFAIIQGPPGTGKTYIGLKITQMLLENSDVWKSSQHSPILVVCYTNHALDQFLEGILAFSKNVIRIGGRSNNEAIKQYQLGELRRAAREKRLVPKHIHYNRHEIVQKIKIIEDTITYYNEALEKCTQQILLFPFLQPFMGRRHSQCFMSPRFGLLRDYNVLHHWLNIPSEEELDFDEDCDEDLEENSVKIENEEDIEFELSLREIGNYKYSRINSNTHFQNGWKKVTKGNRKQKSYIRKQITNLDMMTAKEVRAVSNLWRLEISDRWRLYRFWIVQYAANLLEIIKHIQKAYYNECEKLRELRAAEDKLLLREAEIIGMTTTGAAKYHEYLQDLQPKIVIVEEAAEVLEAHIVTSLTAKTQHLILIGDHQQLKPSPTVYELAERYSFDLSLFERMINNGMNCFQLRKQHRMRPCIAKLLTPHIYRNLENHSSVEMYENISGLESNIFFINHCCHEANVEDTKSHSNVYEAKFLIALCKYLRLQGYNSSNITILTTYSGQLFTIRRLMKAETLLEGVRVTVVDNFQGEENDIILISFVRSNDDGSIGFLKISNRVCVALSRAKKGLYCIGNFELFAEESKLWKNIIGDLVEQKAIGTSLVLCCQNHPQMPKKVTTADDFKKYAPDGGCSQPCNYEMKCGHVCSKFCHPDDKSHTELECKRECDKILCDFKHKCPRRCYEKCGECVVPIDKTIPICGHRVAVPCYLDPDKFSCPVPCNELLSCRHNCQKRCSENCEPCLEKIQIAYNCEHRITIPCYKTPPSTCPEICNRILSCGHKCQSECGKYPCPRCEENVKMPLSCGHMSDVKCCDLQNNVKTCEEACGKAMDCTHECESACGHKGNCGSCDKPCNKILPCNHRCVLKCHEACPELCEICTSILSNVTDRVKDWSDNVTDHVIDWSDEDLDYDE